MSAGEGDARTITVRPAVVGEAGLVFAFVRELAQYERLEHTVDATEQMIASALFGDNPRVFCDIAEWNGEPAGFALWFVNYSSFSGRHGIYLEDLFVRERYRRKGIGRALFTHVACRCAENGFGRLEWAVLDWNSPSIAFYERMGAALLSEWTICRLSGIALQRAAGGA